MVGGLQDISIPDFLTPDFLTLDFSIMYFALKLGFENFDFNVLQPLGFRTFNPGLYQLKLQPQSFKKFSVEKFRVKYVIAEDLGDSKVLGGSLQLIKMGLECHITP